MASAAVLSDTDALMQIKEGSRKLYTKAFNQLREFVDDDMDIRSPSTEELFNYFKCLRFDKKLVFFSNSMSTRNLVHMKVRKTHMGPDSFSSICVRAPVVQAPYESAYAW